MVARGLFGPLVLGVLGLWTLFGSGAIAHAAPKTDPVNLTQFIGPDFFLGLVVHPSRLVKSPMLAGISLPDMPVSPKTPSEAVALMKEFFKPEKIHRVVLLVAPAADGGLGQAPVTVGVICQFEQDVDFEAFLKQDAKLTGEELETATIEGVSCITNKQKSGEPNAAKKQEPQVFVYIAGPRTVLMGPEAGMKKMLAPVAGPQPLLEQLKHASLNNDVLVQLATEQLMKSDLGAMLKAMSQSQPKQPGAELIEDIKSIGLALNVTQEPLLKVAVTGAKPDSADKFFGLLQVAKMGVAAALDGMKKKPPEMLPAEIKEPLFKVADEIVASLKVAKEGDEVALTIAQPPTLPELLKKGPELFKALAPLFMPGGPGIAPPSGAPGTAPPAATPSGKVTPPADADPFAPPPATPESTPAKKDHTLTPKK
jgi:hypothetical protein